MCGIDSEAIQEKLAETDLSLDKAIELPVTMETAEAKYQNTESVFAAYVGT